MFKSVSRILFLQVLCLLALFLSPVQAQLVVINEFMADNDATLLDGDGNYSDWVELVNMDTNTVDLTGWYLSDDTNDLRKWSFPATNLPAGDFLILFASGQATTNYVDASNHMHTTFKLSKNDGSSLDSVILTAADGTNIIHSFVDYPEQSGDVAYGLAQTISKFTYLTKGHSTKAIIPTGIISGWEDPTFTPTGWSSGSSGVGYEAGTGYGSVIGLDVSAMQGVNPSCYIRMEFEVGDPTVLDQLTLGLKYDDGFVAYINGTEVASTNAPATPPWNASATTTHEADVNVYEDFDLTASIGDLVAGTNLLAFQGLNVPVSSSDFLILPELSAYSLGSVNTNLMLYLTTPTPGTNNLSGVLGYVEDVDIDVDHGFFTNIFSVTLTCDTVTADIYYSLNGDSPGPSAGTLYSNAITIASHTILRAAAHQAGYASSEINTRTYVFLADVLQQDSSPPGPDWPSYNVNGQSMDYGLATNVLSDARYTNLIDDALQAIPTLSIVTDPGNLFSASSGIYVNAMSDGIEWERPASVELISTNATEGFQINAGIRIRGASSRDPNNPKHSFRLFFRSEYGDAKLDYELFGEEGDDTFDKIDLRTGQNFSWCNGMPMWQGYATWLYDIVNRDASREMDQPYSRGRFYHIYLNGHYWGLYQTDERPEANFAASYYGGDEDDFDTLKADSHTGGIYATDGSTDAYSNLWAQLTAGVSSNTNYFQLQGMDPDGTRNYSYTRLLDVDNLIDYMLIIYFGGNRDTPIGPPGAMSSDLKPRNLNIVYNRADPDGFKFILHDCEHSFEIDEGVYNDRVNLVLGSKLSDSTNCTPWWMHLQLMSNMEYRVRFGDRVQKHFFNGGLLTPTNISQLWLDRAAEIETAVIAESARWGDYSVSPPRTKDDDWLPAVYEVVSNYFQATPYTRTDVVFSQLCSRAWFPTVDAPAFSQFGGIFTNGFQLTLTSTNPIYYTTDGTDPREIGTGSIVGDTYVSPLSLTLNTIVKARAHNGSDWSALVEATFIPEAFASPLRVTEVMYNPGATTGVETNFGKGEYEFIELLNTATAAAGLAGLEFSEGISFDFNQSTGTVAAGEYVVLVNNLQAFTNRYTNTAIRILGEYSGRFFRPGALSNGGEDVALSEGDTNLVLRFEYDDDWYDNTDGEGFSLTLLDATAETNTWDEKASWRPSANLNGTPGEGPLDFWLPGDIVINEVLAHQDVDNPGDWVELYNASSTTIDINGWFISDDEDLITRVLISNTTAMAAGDYLVLTEYDLFGTNIYGTNGFALSELGDEVFLSSGTNGTLTGYRASEDFGASDNGVTFGRYTRSDGEVNFPALTSNTYEAVNAYPIVGPVILTEVMYHPADSNAFEYVELCNIASSNIALYDVDNPTNTWLLDDAIEYTFPTNSSIDSGEYILLIPTNEAAFRVCYPDIPTNIAIYGPWTGALDNDGDDIKLYKPGTPEALTGEIPEIRVDRLDYNDVVPWCTNADGMGPSLERMVTNEYGNDPINWTNNFALPTPGEEPEDADYDLMPNAWETDNGLDPHDATGDEGTTGDPDSDAMSNYDEYVTDTAPTNSDDFFALDMSTGTNAVTVMWESATNRTYTLQSCTNITNAVWTNTTQLSGTGATQSHTNLLTNACYFRVSVELD